MKLRARPIALVLLLVGVLAVVAAGCGDDDSGGGTASSGGGGGEQKKFKIGVCNTLVGNGWREEMICSVKAQAARLRPGLEVLVAQRQRWRRASRSPTSAT